MFTFKQFDSKEVLITPFDTSKTFTLVGDEQILDSDLGIDFFTGIKHELISGSAFEYDDNLTGINSSQDTLSIYHSIYGLYYNTSSYSEKYYQSSYYFDRYFPSQSEATISVISIPVTCYGENIVPTTFKFNYDYDSISYSLIDDGEGNIRDSSEEIVGNIFYSHGLITLTTGSYVDVATQISSSLLDNTEMEFSSTYKFYEHEYKCVIRANEFHYSTNPTLIKSGSYPDYKDFVNEPYFFPYITTVGLYNNEGDLLAIGKLSSPIPLSKIIDTTIIVNFDTY